MLTTSKAKELIRDHELSNILDAILLEKFDGIFFWIWQREMKLYLAHLKLDKYLVKDKPVKNVGNTDVFILASICVDPW